MAKGNEKSSKKTKNTPKSMFDPQNMLKSPNNLTGNIFFYIFIALGLYLLFTLFSDTSLSTRQAPISEVITLIRDERVQDIKVSGDNIEVLLKDGTTLYTKKESQISFDEILANNNVDISSIGGQLTVEESVGVGQILSSVLIYGLPVLLLIFIMRSMRSASSDVFSFGKSKAKMFNKESSAITFDDVAGIEEAKTEMREIVDFLKHPQKYMDVGARIPKGVLLVGPAGVGKTLLAKAIAGEAGVPFFSVAGSEFMEMLVGVGSSRVRDLFKMAKAAQPALIFIDEIDAIGRQRGMGIGGGHDEREQTLNQILIEMDGFDERTNVIVIAASVTGDTPVLIKENGELKITPIGEFVDKHYNAFEENVEKPTYGVQALSYKQTGNEIKPHFTPVSGVFRHKVDEIYEIKYLGGTVRATGNHSVFIWKDDEVIAKPVSELNKGDILVDITPRTFEDIEKNDTYFEKYEEVYEKDNWLEKAYSYAMSKKGILSQEELSESLGFAQTTISLWHRGINGPRDLSRNYYKHVLPEKIKVTPEFARLLGYYTAEGYARKEINFCFNENEKEYIKDVKVLMNDIFGISECKVRTNTHGAVNLIFHSRPVADMFNRLCGSGAHNKHIPEFLFEAPYAYYKEYLKGLYRGDGHIDKSGKMEITSVSKRLVVELTWLSRMHGVKAYQTSFTTKEGRRINSGKPLKSMRTYRIGFGKYYNIFNNLDKADIKRNPKRAKIRSISKVPFDGYVYDLCGCGNEAFFGGDNPILLHNTNRPDMLDPALVRAGRFDRKVTIPMPDLEGRKEIIQIHMKGKPFAEDFDLEKVAKKTVGFSGADIENVLNESAIYAAREDRKTITMRDIDNAALKVTMGPERKRLADEHDRKLAAYHEAGHAIVGALVEGLDAVGRVTIVPRGGSLGHTSLPPERDRYNETKSRLLAMISMIMGGRAAEEIVFSDVTTGASSDFEKATSIARKMVTEWGMSPLGPINLGGDEERHWIAKQIGESHVYSQEVAARVDAEIENILNTQYARALEILNSNRAKLDEIAGVLLEKETIDGSEFAELMQG